MPAEAVNRLNSEINAVLKSPEFQQRLRTLGYDAAGGTPAEFARVVQRDRDKWTQLIRERKITIE
jgi:tripartite-type tricarboxylate transporter receptor subunit TctC